MARLSITFGRSARPCGELSRRRQGLEKERRRRAGRGERDGALAMRMPRSQSSPEPPLCLRRGRCGRVRDGRPRNDTLVVIFQDHFPVRGDVVAERLCRAQAGERIALYALDRPAELLGQRARACVRFTNANPPRSRGDGVQAFGRFGTSAGSTNGEATSDPSRAYAQA